TEQRVLEAASVSGLTFAAGVVAHALDAQVDEVDSCCETLANERRLLQYLGTETWTDGTIQSRYAFRHALIQHAALARSPSSSLRLWHRRIAERLEEGYAGREDQVAAELAVHFDEGHQFAKAAPHYLVAGERAAGRHGHVEAVVHFERSRHLVARLPEGRERDELELRVLHGLGPSLLATKAPTAHDLIATVERAVELATHLKDDVRRGAALVVLQRCRLWKGDFRAVGEHADEVMAAVERVPDPVLRASAAQLGGGAAFARGNFTEARRLLDLARAIDEADGAIPSEPLVAALSVGALLAWLTGRPDEALALAHDSVRSAEALREPSALTQALCGVATVRAWRGEPQQAEEPAQRALATATEEHMSFWRNRALSLVHWAKSELDPTTSAAHVDEQPSEPWDSRFAGRTLDALLFISLCARVGRETRALEEIASALAFADSNDERFLAPELHRLRGELLKASDRATAERSFTTAIDLAKKQSSTAFELRSTLSLHRIVGGARRRRIRDELRRLVSTYNEGLDTGDLRDARAVLAD
ncbi:MAG: zinc-ribbon protein, partial [Myxococcaceae bacterium]|nr:zinc-ribbon protein [Myxococcaceae bacterium]